MGALYKGVCYPSEGEAQVQTCASFFSHGVSGGSLTSVECLGVQSGVLNLCRRTDGGSCSQILQPLPVYPSCSFDAPASVASEYFGVVLGFLVVVFVASRLYRLFWNNHEAI